VYSDFSTYYKQFRSEPRGDWSALFDDRSLPLLVCACEHVLSCVRK